MEQTLFAIAWLALGSWLGAVVFLSAVLAPTVFRTLDAAIAGRFPRLLFPRPRGRRGREEYRGRPA